jgi:hypothetical protein
MANDVITQARRRAKSMSRSSELTYQQSLDAVARQDGHATWKAMTTAFPDQDESPPDRNSEATPNPSAVRAGWRMRALERAEGSRHQPIDEYGIRTVGGPIARTSAMLRVPVVVAAILVPALVMMLTSAVVGDPVRDVGLVLAFMVAPACMVATLRNPDHRGAVRMRRNARLLAAFTLTLALATALTGMVQYHNSFADTAIDNGRLALIPAAFCLCMWITAWEGRRRRRGEKPGAPEGVAT